MSMADTTASPDSRDHAGDPINIGSLEAHHQRDGQADLLGEGGGQHPFGYERRNGRSPEVLDEDSPSRSGSAVIIRKSRSHPLPHRCHLPPRSRKFGGGTTYKC